jgi:hypothetical protein
LSCSKQYVLVGDIWAEHDNEDRDPVFPVSENRSYHSQVIRGWVYFRFQALRGGVKILHCLSNTETTLSHIMNGFIGFYSSGLYLFDCVWQTVDHGDSSLVN